MASPEGIVIHRHWMIGKKIGNGACGSVHELVSLKDRATTTGKRNMEEPVIHAIKLARLPDPSAKPKSKESIQRKTHADILHYEALVYQNHLVDLRGKLIPELPLRPVTGDIEGLRFLIMEKMAAPFDQVVSDIASGKRSFATVALHLVSLVEAVHDRKLLVIDIKPDNFMVAPSGEIVMIDLGLVQTYASLGGHRKNTAPGGGVVGTPLYASLHLFQGENASRRDDLEALGYLLMEVILQVTAGKELPWSKGRSEEEIGKLKEKSLFDLKGAIWKSLGSVAGPALRSFFEQVHSLGYSKKPEYDALRKLLQKVEIGCKPHKRKIRAAQGPTDSTERVSTSASFATVGRTTATSRRDAAGSAKTEATTKKRSSPVKLSERPAKKQGFCDDDFESLHSMQVEEDYQTCTDDAMDWEVSNNPVGVSLQIVTGPHEGEILHLIQGERESVVFGLRPDEPQEYILPGDPAIDLAHAQVTLQVNKNFVNVLVKDLKSSSGTLVEKSLIKSGKFHKAFLNDTIAFGETSIKVVPLKTRSVCIGSKENISDAHEIKLAGKENFTPIPSIPRSGVELAQGSKARGFRLEFSAGPHKGASIVLKDGDVDSVVLGANPDPKVGQSFRLDKDPSVTDPSHVRFELDASRKGFCSLRVVDMKSLSGIRLNGIQVGKGKKETAFANDSVVIGKSIIQINPI